MKPLIYLILLTGISFAQTKDAPDQKSIIVGTHLSALSTVLPVAYGLYSAENWNNDVGPTIALGGFLFGPAIGLLYAEDSYKAGRGVCIRGASIWLLNLSASKFDVFESNKKNQTAYILLGLSAAIGLTSVIMDFGAVPVSVRKYNEKHQVTVAPVVDPKLKMVGVNMAYRY